MLFIDIINDNNLYTVRYLRNDSEEIESGVIDIEKDTKEQEFYYKLFLEVSNEKVCMWTTDTAKKLHKIGSLGEKNFQIDEVFLIKALGMQIKQVSEMEELKGCKVDEIKEDEDVLLYMKNICNTDTKKLYESYVALQSLELVNNYMTKFANSENTGAEMISNIHNSMIYYFKEVHNSSFMSQNRITYNLLGIMNKESDEESDEDLVEIPF